jgi:hypothetical protein
MKRIGTPSLYVLKSKNTRCSGATPAFFLNQNVQTGGTSAFPKTQFMATQGMGYGFHVAPLFFRSLAPLNKRFQVIGDYIELARIFHELGWGGLRLPKKRTVTDNNFAGYNREGSGTAFSTLGWRICH